MNDLARTERLLNILYTIQKHPGIQTKVLADIFGRTPRTIQRDISDLRRMGFKIASSTGAAGGFASRGEYYLKSLLFTGAEALAIFVASKVLLDQKGFPYSEDLEVALKKISEAVLEKDEFFLQKMESRTSIGLSHIKDYYPWGNIFTQINQAILEQITIEIIYDSYSSDKVSVRKVNPYHMMFKEGYWYLIAHCDQREQIRIFRLDRIREAKATAHKFQLPSDFAIENYLKDSWQLGKGELITVKLRFFPPISRLIRENTWHHTQEIQELPDDSLIFKVRVEGTFEIKRWILSWGCGAMCLEPEKLRKEIAQELMELVEGYK